MALKPFNKNGIKEGYATVPCMPLNTCSIFQRESVTEKNNYHHIHR